MLALKLLVLFFKNSHPFIKCIVLAQIHFLSIATLNVDGSKSTPHFLFGLGPI